MFKVHVRSFGQNYRAAFYVTNCIQNHKPSLKLNNLKKAKNCYVSNEYTDFLVMLIELLFFLKGTKLLKK